MTDAIAKLNEVLGKILSYGPSRKGVAQKNLKNTKKTKRSKNQLAQRKVLQTRERNVD